MMKRREFMTLAGGAAVAWPQAVWAQQSERMRRIGVLLPASPDDPDYQTRISALAQGLAPAGPEAIQSSFAAMRRNWSLLGQTSC
jgi:putative ABC transport system substrate-binding protein